MEFSGFDDDLFQETEKRAKRAEAVDYKPKSVPPQASPDDDIDKVHFYIFRGNQHYYRRAWSDALDAYTEALDYVAPNNGNFRRLLLESVARCRWRLGDADGAVEMGKKLVEESSNDHQLFCAHAALAMFYDAAGNADNQASSLRLCLDLRPLSVQHWIQLAKVHLKKFTSKSCRSVSNPDAAADNLQSKGFQGQSSDNTSFISDKSHSAFERTSHCDSANVELSSSSTQHASAQNGNSSSLTGQGRHKYMSRECRVDKKGEYIMEKSQNGMDKNCVSHVGHDSDGCIKRLFDQSSSLMSSMSASVSSSASSLVSSSVQSTSSSASSSSSVSFTSSSVSSTSSSVLTALSSVSSVSSSISSSVSSTASSRSSSVSLKQEDSPALTGNIQRQCRPSPAGDNNSDLDRLSKLSLDGKGTLVSSGSQVNGLLMDESVGDTDEEQECSVVMEAVKCLLRAKVILKSLQICAVSITKMRNDQLLAEIDEWLSTLHLDAAFIQEMSKKMYNEVYDKDIKEEVVTS
ncbi:uncharacterized protein LOC121431324 isoform X2 [Lytechinus variegatus]|uniref:uncharacterized protein LOC121431324 isoform X2 n=1 Tax=Lytechinus variegatus TaxID=7654 RepID=UPI001BB11ED9|nr:uncharacterized protein LOC121431324 isoform X2 [Lytechinus variegatus]